MGLSVIPASADHASWDYFEGPQGPVVLNGESVCMANADFSDYISATTIDNARVSIVSAIDEVESTAFPYNYPLEAESCGNFPFVGTWNNGNETINGFCAELSNNPNRKSSIQMEDLSSVLYGVVAIGIACDLDLNGFLDFFVIAFNSGWVGGGYGWNELKYHGDPTSTDPLDFRGLVTHEMVHAIGFYGHFPNAITACDTNTTNFNTMCLKAWGYQYGISGSSGKAYRTLNTHDTGAIAGAY
jgi:hypothetical protein